MFLSLNCPKLIEGQFKGKKSRELLKRPREVPNKCFAQIQKSTNIMIGEVHC